MLLRPQSLSRRYLSGISKLRVLVCGSRHYDPLKTEDYLDEYFRDRETPSCIIEGGASGADCGGRHFGVNRGIPVETYKADWNKYGKAAGPIRNGEMLRLGKPELVIAFLARESRGTKNMLDQAKKAGVEVMVVEI